MLFKKSLCITISALFLCFQCNLATYANDIIEDSVALNCYKGQKLSKPVFKRELIVDEVVSEFYKEKNPSKHIFKLNLIEDNFVAKIYRGKQLSKTKLNYKLLEDEVVIARYSGQKLTKPVFSYRLFDENTVDVEVTVSSSSVISTNHVHFESFGGIDLGRGIDIGNPVTFHIVNDVKKDGKLVIRKGTPVKAIIGNIISSSSGGAPAEVTVERFITQDIYGNKIELFGEVQKRGINLYLPYYLLAVGGYPFTFGLSAFILYLHGGQARISPGHEFTLYYED